MDTRYQVSKEAEFADSDFRKSSFSNSSGGHCLLVAEKEGIVAVRNSKDPTKKTIVFTRDEWSAFIRGAKAGEFDI